MKKKFLIAMIVGSLLFMPTTYAETKTYTGVGEYSMGERDTLEIAKQGAKEKAMRNALEQAGVLVTSHSRTEDMELVEDVITSRTGAVLHVLEVVYERSDLIIKAIVKVDIDPEDLNRRLQNAEPAQKKLPPPPVDKDNENLYMSNKKVEEADILMSEGKLDNVLSILEEATQLDSTNAAIYEKLGWFYRVQNDYEKALSNYDKAVKLDPNNGAAYNGRGECYKALGNKDKAREDFSQSKNIATAKEKIRAARKLCEEDKYDAATPFASDSLALNPKNAWAWSTFGNIYNGKQDYEKAIFYYQKALELNPKIGEAYNGLGHAYMNLSQYDKAITYFSKAIEFSPFHANALTYRSRGECYKARGDLKKSQEDFIKAKQLGWEN